MRANQCFICAGEDDGTTYTHHEGNFVHMRCLSTAFKNCSASMEQSRAEIDTLLKRLRAMELEARMPKTFTFRGMSEAELNLMMEHYRGDWDIIRDLAHARKALKDTNMALFEAGAIAGKSYLEGIKEGIRRFAWWKDGTQYVGSCGTTLKQALKEVDPDGNGQ